MWWNRGYLVRTKDVAKWPKEEQLRVAERESQSVFDRMGKLTDRRQICWVNPSHPDYEKNMKLIVMAPQNKSDRDYFLEQLNDIRKMSWWQKLKWIFRNE